MKEYISFIDFTNISDEEKYKLLNSKDNIINELEEYICAIEYDERHSECWEIPVRIHNKLKELKGSGSNEYRRC